MGTRAVVQILNEREKVLASIWCQFDGYLWGGGGGVGQRIKTLLGKSTVNGYHNEIGTEECPEFFSDPGCLAAYMVGWLKLRKDLPEKKRKGELREIIGGIALMAPADKIKKKTVEFFYTVWACPREPICVTVHYWGKEIFRDQISNFDPKVLEDKLRMDLLDEAENKVKRQEFIAEAKAADIEFKRTGEAIPHSDVVTYFEAKKAGKNPSPPKPVKISVRKKNNHD